MIWLWDNAVTIANVVMAAAAIAALIYAHLQINEGKRAERRANAHQLWNETLHLAFDNPKLSDPTLRLAEFDYEARTIDGSIETFQKYELYVDTILNASEGLFLALLPSKYISRERRMHWRLAKDIACIVSIPSFMYPT